MGTIGTRIRRARELRDMTQRELGEKLGVSYQAVSQWERDETRPDFERIPAIRRALDVGITWLLEESGSPDDDPEMIVAEGLTAPERAAVRAMIESFKREKNRVA